MERKVNVGIVGGAGYTAGELLRILIEHPAVELKFVQSSSQAGKNIAEIHTDLTGRSDLIFTEKWISEVDVIFLCRGHNHSKFFLSENVIPSSVKLIDLSQDFRLAANSQFSDRQFIYGLPELNKELIKSASNIANPGCFATSIELALLPIASHITEDIHIHSITGSTGAGQSLGSATHFSYRNNNISSYKVFSHQHLFEIKETISKANSNFNKELHLVPVRGDFTRGIFSSIYTKISLSESELFELYQSYYSQHPFVIVTDKDISLKQVVNTNNCILSVRKLGGMVYIVSIVDNLLKGASGQAVQNMNLMFGMPEISGLRLKPVGF